MHFKTICFQDSLLLLVKYFRKKTHFDSINQLRVIVVVVLFSALLITA